jgi:hypothetical protein
MTAKQLREQIDACRPGCDDIEQEEFRELATALPRDAELRKVFGRSQQLDGSIRDSFQSVVPPEGLQDRILDAIENEPSSKKVNVELRAKHSQRFSRRSLVTWSSLATILAITAMVVLWMSEVPSPMLVADHQLANRVDQWNAELDEAAWQATANIPVESFPIWRNFAVRGIARWQWVSKEKIACYDFATNGEQVRLFVMHASAAASFPSTPPVGYPSSKGWHVGAWQANGQVYFLAVYDRGNSKQLYSKIIASPYGAA